jgi:signal transduction histidine kinase/CheY-like chemotaxis protein
MKNKTLLALSVTISLSFLFYLVHLTEDIRKIEQNLIESKNIIDVTDQISTKFSITPNILSDFSNTKEPSANWKSIKLPSSLAAEKDFKQGNFVYYRILIPKAVSEQLEFLGNELEFSPQYLLFSKSEIYVNGNLYKEISPLDSNESIVNIPIKNGQDNIVAIKGHIKNGDIGIAHRGRLLLGKGAELNELHRKSYKRTTVYSLIFVLCKASILFVFTLIYVFVNVAKFFEMSLLFGIFALVDDVLTGEYLNGFINFNQKVYLYNFVNVCEVIFLIMFLSYVTSTVLIRKKMLYFSLFLFCIPTLMSIDVLNYGKVFNIDDVLRFWNYSMIFAILFFIPKVLKKDKILFAIIMISCGLTVWSTFFSSNVGHNLKAFGNLFIFFMVAYQTFVSFKEEQELSQAQEIKLLEHEKDAAIGRVATFLAHDVRRPLVMLNLMIQSLSNGEKSKEFLDTAKHDIEFAIKSVTNQVNEIINYKKNISPVLEVISFYKTLEGSLKQIMIPHSHLNIEIEYVFNAQTKILGEEGRLTTILVNLLSNAIEAIYDIGLKTKGKICISTSVSDSDFEFRVFNDGPPIPKEVLDKLFDSQVSFGKKHGTGLGLRSVLKALKEMNGTIEVMNLAQEGVEFKVRLKSTLEADRPGKFVFLKNSNDYSYDSDHTKATSPLRSNNLNIFILCSDNESIENLKKLISNLPFKSTLFIATSYAEGVLSVSKRNYDLYVLSESDAGNVLYSEKLSFLSKEVIVLSNKTFSMTIGQLPLLHTSLTFDSLLYCCVEIINHKPNILLVDDDKFIRLAWSNFYFDNLACAGSPEQALDFIARDESIEICVVDYHYNNSSMDGELLFKKILQIKPNMKIFISSNSEKKFEGIISIKKDDYDIRKFLK